MQNFGYQTLGPEYIQASIHSREYLDWNPSVLYGDWEEFMNDVENALYHIHESGQIPPSQFAGIPQQNVLLSLEDEANLLIEFTGNKLYRKCPDTVTSYDGARRERCIRTKCEQGLENILKYGIEAKQKLQQALNGERPEPVPSDPSIFDFCPDEDQQ